MRTFLLLWLAFLAIVPIDAKSCELVDSQQRLGHAASHRVVLIDPDNDGTLDAVVANRAEPSVYWKNQGNGRLVLGQELKHTDGGELNDYTWSVAALDANADGHEDIVLLGDASGSSSASRIWLWAPARDRFIPEGTKLPPEADFVRASAVGDFNEDGHSDLVVGGLFRVAVLLMDVSTVTMTTSFADPSLRNVYGLDVGDINEDGHLDIVVVRTDGPNEILLGAGDGTFTAKQNTFPGSSMEWSRGVALGDLNGDGHLDAAIANRALGRLKDSTVWFGDGQGGFQDSGQRLEPDSDSYAIELADVDGDGDLDAVLANWASNSVWINNNAAGTFLVKMLAHTGTLGTFDVAVGDLTQSGDPDLFFADNNGGGEGAPNAVWINDCQVGPPPSTTTTTTTGGQPQQPPDETSGVTVVLQFEGTTPSVRLVPIDHCGKRKEQQSVSVRFDSIVEKDAYGNSVKTVDFQTSTYTYTRPREEHHGEEAFRFATEGHGGGTTITFDVSLFRSEAKLEDIVGNVSFTIHPDTFKWSILLDSWPFWGDQVERHTLELKVTLKSEDGDISEKQLPAVAVQESEHLSRYMLGTTHTDITVRVLDIAEVDGEPAAVTHSLDIGTGGDVQGLKIVFPKFDQQIAFDPDVSILLGKQGDDDECGRDSTNAAVYMALASVLIPACILLALVILAAAVIVPKARNWWHRRRRAHKMGGAINFELDDTEEQGQLVSSRRTASEQNFEMVQVHDLQAGEEDTALGISSSSSSDSSIDGILPAGTQFVRDPETEHVFPIPAGDSEFSDGHDKKDD